MERGNAVSEVLIYTLLANVAVSTAKMVCGCITNSIAMISDGFHSLFDGASNIVGLVGTCIASQPPDNTPMGTRNMRPFSPW